MYVKSSKQIFVDCHKVLRSTIPQPRGYVTFIRHTFFVIATPVLRPYEIWQILQEVWDHSVSYIIFFTATLWKQHLWNFNRDF